MKIIGELKAGKNSVEWRIPDFFSLPKDHYECYECPSFQCAGELWKLCIYPGFMCVELLICSSSAECRATFRVGLKVDGTYVGNKERSHTFSAKKPFERCLLPSRKDVERRRSELAPSDVLTIVCYIRRVKSPTQHPKDPVPVNEPSRSVEDSSKETKLESCLEKMSSDFNDLLLSDEDSDLTVKVKDVDFHLHRVIMRARVPVFSAMFKHDMKEKATGLVCIDDCEAEVFRAFVRYVYSGKVDQLSTDTVFGLFALADKYQVGELKSACFEYVQSTLSVDTFCDVVTLALTYDQRELLEQATDYFAQKMEDILKTVKWMNFLRNHYVQANELMLKAVQRKNPK